MLNLVNKIITVILSLIVMINYSNGFITDKNVFLDTEKFTTEKIETCEQFNEVSSQYTINHNQYFLDEKGNFYRLYYNSFDRMENSYAPFRLYKLTTNIKSGDFIECKDDIIYFKFKKSLFIFRLELKDLHFLKPVDTFVQPPELVGADTIGTVTTCSEFDQKVIEENTTGFLIYKNKLDNSFNRFCLWQGCAINDYYYSESPKTESLESDPFGFYWKDKSGSRNSIKWVYHNCQHRQLTLVKVKNGKHHSSGYITLSNLTFYNIKPKTRSLEDVQLHLLKKLSTCSQFYEYLKNHKNILDGYIYFFDIRRLEDIKYLTKYLAMKINLYGPEDIREKSYLLGYTEINTKNKGFVPVKPVQFFVSCQTRLLYSDTLVYELDSDSNVTFFIELKNLLFYDGDEPPSEGDSGIEMKVLNKAHS